MGLYDVKQVHKITKAVKGKVCYRWQMWVSCIVRYLLLNSSNLVYVTAPPGCGKSLIALALAGLFWYEYDTIYIVQPTDVLVKQMETLHVHPQFRVTFSQNVTSQKRIRILSMRNFLNHRQYHQHAAPGRFRAWDHRRHALPQPLFLGSDRGRR